MNAYSDRLPIHALQQGQGPPVILVHGIAASAYAWTRLMADLALSGYQAYAPDLPGHGDSHKPNSPEHYHIQEIYTVFESWVESLFLPEKPVLIGHSLGGHLSLQYSLRHPGELCGMVLIDPFYSPQQLFPFVRWVQRQVGRQGAALPRASTPLLKKAKFHNPYLGPPAAQQYRRQIALDLGRASPMILHILPTVPDLTSSLPDITTPTQVVWGCRDRTLSAASFPVMVSLLPNAIGFRVAGGGHLPHLTQSHLVTPAILEFIKRLT